MNAVKCLQNTPVDEKYSNPQNAQANSTTKGLESESTTGEAATLLELKATTTTTAREPTAAPLPEEELLLSTAATEWRALERITLLFLAVGVVAVIKALLELRVGQDFVGFVKRGHLLLGFLRGDVVCRGFVRVVLFGQFPVGFLDLALVRIAVNPENLVVVLLL